MDYTPLKISDIGFVIRSKFGWIILYSVIFAFLGFLISKTVIIPTYEASTEVLVNQKHSNSDQAYSNQQADIQIINTYKNLLTNPFVIKKVVKKVNVENNGSSSRWTNESLRKAIKVKTQPSSQAFSITVKSDNARKSAKTANLVTSIFKEKVHKVMKNNNVIIISKASTPKRAVLPNYKLNIIIGALLGFICSFIYFVIHEQINGHVIHKNYIDDKFNVKNLGELHLK